MITAPTEDIKQHRNWGPLGHMVRLSWSLAFKRAAYKGKAPRYLLAPLL
jgi:hypothetical protein